MPKIKLLMLTTLAVLMVLSFFNNNKSPEKIFWEWFESKSAEFYHLESMQDAMLDEMARQLKKSDSGLTFQFGPIDEVSKKRELVISADGISSVIPVVIRLVDSAPSMEKWNVKAFRQRVDDSPVLQLGEAKLTENDVYFEDIDEGDKTGLKLYIRGYDGSNDYGSAVFIMLDWLLGEYDVMTRVGSIEFKILNEEDKSDLKSVKELPKLIDSKKTIH